MSKQAERICAHTDRVWMICWPSAKHGLVPIEHTCHMHQKDAWSKMEGGREVAEERGYVARRFWLSLDKE